MKGYPGLGGKIVISEGSYIYCICEEEGSGLIDEGEGAGGEGIYFIRHMDIFAVAKDFSGRGVAGFDPESGKALEEMVMAHHAVVEKAFGRFTTVPMRFGYIIRPGSSGNSAESTLRWLEKNYSFLKERLEKVRGREEYGIEVSRDCESFAGKISGEAPEIKRLKEEMKSRKEGARFIYGEKIKLLIRREMESRGEAFFRDLYEGTSKIADATKRTAPGAGGPFLKLACLVKKGNVKTLLEFLRRMEGDGMSMRLTGPWPPYSFV